ncbi:TPA: hypothetical protein JBL19_06200 [Legionella pneumophila]|nr:hypothetical protein [Legionella pneumophila subsp. fraseri]HAT1796295.1 hypothetical protein [Legionella pneumophila]MDW8961438.1 hypothetical protein [Legionella pneumophila subsp. fraseri]MDW9036286.1 hypothetical protein [Legionella pneumophila subsp. fraseri]MDW9038957.1 hypothetical protein [Legionella pneumophila subsp. fraseri]
MSEEKKEQVAKCKVHHFIVTGWLTKGGNQSATHMRCAQCLMPVCLEELQSKEWKEAQGF